MPLSIKEIEPKKPVPFAQTPEFQKLQDAINQAKEALDDVARQIVAVESKLNTTGPQAGYPVAPAPEMPPQPDPESMPSIDPASPVAPVASPGMRSRPAFEEAIEDMRRIAGLR